MSDDTSNDDEVIVTGTLISDHISYSGASTPIHNGEMDGDSFPGNLWEDEVVVYGVRQTNDAYDPSTAINQAAIIEFLSQMGVDNMDVIQSKSPSKRPEKDTDEPLTERIEKIVEFDLESSLGEDVVVEFDQGSGAFFWWIFEPAISSEDIHMEDPFIG